MQELNTPIMGVFLLGRGRLHRSSKKEEWCRVRVVLSGWPFSLCTYLPRSKGVKSCDGQPWEGGAEAPLSGV